MTAWQSLVAASAALLLPAVASLAESAPKCELQQIDEWPVRLLDHRVIVDGTANGQPITLLLGTGAQQSLMMRAAAQRLQLNREWTRGFPLFGLGGESRSETVTVNELGLGRFAFRGWQLQVPIDQQFGDEFDMVLGEDFFANVDVEFDLAHGAVRLFVTQGNCDGESLAYWAPDGAAEVAIERVFRARPQILLPVRVNGQPVRALLDTGATVSVLALRDARDAGLTPETAGVAASGRLAAIGAEPVQLWAGSLTSFAVAGKEHHDVAIRFGDLYRNVRYSLTGSHVPYRAGPEQPMLLGVDFLRSHRVLVAHSQQKVYLTPVGGTAFEAGDGVSPASAWVGGSMPGLR